MQIIQDAVTWLQTGENYKWVFDWFGLLIITSLAGFISWLFRVPLCNIFYLMKKKWAWKTKANTTILFVDNKHFPIVDLLRSSGYQYNTRRVKDIEGPNDPNLQGVDIFFVDIQGVGKKMRLDRQGFWLVEFLKQLLPKSKVVIYSEENIPSDPAYRLADEVMQKESDGYEFSRVIDRLITEL